MEYMNYRDFRSALREVYADCGIWTVTFDWEEKESSERDPELDTMELETEIGPFYDLRIVSVTGLYELYKKSGWEAVVTEMERRPAAVKRRGGSDFLVLLNDDGKLLYEKLRKVRAEIAKEYHLPPYLIFSNRTLFSMVKMLPVDLDQLKELYGVGERNSAVYGAPFIEAISSYTGGVWREMLAV